jgi:23S rRNA (pseudouridine1915-N3)-methyltransferase
MKITIAAVGRLRSGPAKTLFDDYTKRLKWPVTLREVGNGRGSSAAERLRNETKALAGAIPKGATVVGLDEAGDQLSSRKFAARLEQWRDGGVKELAFVIGGADGLAAEITADAARMIALGPQTWPHFLVRAMLAEQLYRAYTILTGHPYHRE